MKKRQAFISLKDQKENFENNPKCRLINPTKSDSRKISKSIILEKINTKRRSILNVNQCQWRNSQNQGRKKQVKVGGSGFQGHFFIKKGHLQVNTFTVAIQRNCL